MWNLKKTKKVQMNFLQNRSHRCRKQTLLPGDKEGRDELGHWDQHIYTTMYKIYN